MENVRGDHYPSATQMELLEEIIPQPLVPDYLDILLDKVAADSIPSIPMLVRIRRVVDTLPVTEQRG
jgi:hypothetical protein